MICDLPTYRRIANDTSSIDGDATAALVDAQAYFEAQTDRFFESAQRTETMRLYPNGRVYPKAFPVTVVDGGTIDGAAVTLGYGLAYPPGVNPFVSGYGQFGTAYQPQVTKTYTGGYDSTSMPYEVKRAVATLAYNMLHTNALTGVPVGATSVSLGDLSVGGRELSGLDPVTASVARIINQYKRPQVEPF